MDPYAPFFTTKYLNNEQDIREALGIERKVVINDGDTMDGCSKEERLEKENAALIAENKELNDKIAQMQEFISHIADSNPKLHSSGEQQESPDSHDSHDI